MHINNPNDDAANIKDAMVVLGFRQDILFPTQESSKTLDLIFLEEYSNIKVRTCRKGNFISDHYLNTCTTTLTNPDIKCNLVNYRNLKDINADLMSVDIKLDYFEDIPLSNLVHQFETSLREALEKYTPIQSKSIAERRYIPWFTRCERSQKENALQRKAEGESLTGMNSGLHLKMLEDLTKHLTNRQREASLANSI